MSVSLETIIALSGSYISEGGPPVVESIIGSQWGRLHFCEDREARCLAFQRAEMRNAVSAAAVPVSLSEGRCRRGGHSATISAAICIEAAVTIAVGVAI